MADNVDIEIRAKNATQQAFDQISEQLKALEGTAKTTSDSASEGFTHLFETMTGGVAAGELLATSIEKAFDVIKEIPGELVEMGTRGGQIVDVENAFDRLAGGADHAREILAALNAGTKDTVPNFDLLKTANKLLADGFHGSADQFGIMGAGARLLSKDLALQGGTAEAMDILSQAMATGRSRALNLIGVHVDADAALAHYSTTIGKSVSDFTAQDKVAANSAETLRLLKAKLDDAGDSQLSFGEKILQGKKAFADFSEEIEEGIAKSPVLAAGMDAAGKAVIDAFGSNQQAAVHAVVGAVDELAIDVGKFAIDAVEGVRFLGNAWFDLDALVSQAIKGWTEDQIRALAVMDGAAGALAKIPGPQQALFQQGHELLQVVIADAATLDSSVTAHLNSGGSAVGTFNKTLDTMHAGLETVVSAMQAAQGAHEATAAAAGKHGAALDDLGGKQHKVTDEVKKFTDASNLLGDEYDALEAQVGTDAAIDQLGKKLHDAGIKALELGVDLDSLHDGVARGNADFNSIQFAKTMADQAAKVHDGIGSLIDDLDKQAAAAGLATSKDWASMSEGWLEAERRMSEATMSGTTLRLAQIDDQEKKELNSFHFIAGEDEAQYAQRLALVKAYYQQQRDLATASSTDIDALMHASGLRTQSDLDEDATHTASVYQAMVAAGDRSTIELEAAWQKMVTANAAAGHGWLQSFDDDLGKVGASILTTFASGGSVGQAAQSGAGLLGGDLSKHLLQPMVDGLAAAGHGELSKTLGDMAGPLGSVAATLGIDLGKKLWDSLFGDAGRQAVVTFANSLGGFAVLQKQLEAVGPAGQQMWIDLTQGVGNNDAAGAAAAIKKVQDALGALNADVQKYGLTYSDLTVGSTEAMAAQAAAATALEASFKDLTGAGYTGDSVVKGMATDVNTWLANTLAAGAQIPPGMEPIVDKLIQMGLLTSDNTIKLLGLSEVTLDGGTFDDVTKAAQKYGIQIDALGPKVNQLQIDSAAATLSADWKTLTSDGEDVNAVMDGMKGQVQDVVTEALKFGDTIPESMKPMIDAMITAGDLTDGLGNKLTDDSKLNFAKPIEQSVDDLVTAVGKLVDTLSKGITFPVKGQYVPDPNMPVGSKGGTDDGGGGGDDGSLPKHAVGAYIRADHVAQVHAGEIVGPKSFIAAAMVDAFQALGVAPGGGGSDQSIVINLDGQKMADILVRHVPDSLGRFGIR